MNINNKVNMGEFIDIFSADADKKTNIGTESFEAFLKESLNKVNDLQIESDKKTELLATGQIENIHDVTIAAAKAKISLDLTMAVRNKVVEAYKEVMRMQV